MLPSLSMTLCNYSFSPTPESNDEYIASCRNDDTCDKFELERGPVTPPDEARRSFGSFASEPGDPDSIRTRTAVAPDDVNGSEVTWRC